MISVICVYNKKDIVENYLKKSIEQQNDCEYELIFIDNRKQTYKNASDAINEGVKRANGDILIWCHQDIILEDNKTFYKIQDYLHQNKKCGILGVAGTRKENKKEKTVITNMVHGKDKKIAGNKNIYEPEECETLDECILAMRKDMFYNCNLEKSNIYTWHLYGTEYSIKVKQNGYQVIVFPIKCWHLSEGSSFDESYFKQIKKLAKIYKKQMKVIRTTMGIWYTNICLLNLKIIYSRLKGLKK